MGGYRKGTTKKEKQRSESLPDNKSPPKNISPNKKHLTLEIDELTEFAMMREGITPEDIVER